MIELVRANESDIDFLLDLRMLTMTDHLNSAGIVMDQQQHKARVLHGFEYAHIILQNREKVGLLKFVSSEIILDIVQFQIHPKSQNKGLGNTVLILLKAMAEKQNKNLTLKVLKANPAKELYLRFGFTVVGEDDLEYHMEMVV